MPKIVCKCDQTIDLNEIPSPHQYMFISDEAYDDYSGSIDSEELYMNMNVMIKCPNCLRIHIYWNGFENNSVIYSIDG